jgi:hypothetical protein
MVPRTLYGALLAAVAMSTCSAQGPPTPLFESRVAVEPLLAKLTASGGDPKKILHLRAAAEVAGLEAGKRYRFVVLDNGRLAVAPIAADSPGNQYVHPVLGEGKAVRTAGGIRVEREGSALKRVTVDQDSQAYCPTADSLAAALAELVRIGVPRDRLRVENRPPACVGAPPPPEAPARFGALMAEVGQRFERMGRAARARRLDLATFEVEEIGEIFEEDLPKAEPPRENTGVNLAGVEQAFRQTNLPELRAALQAKDAAAFKAAYLRAAETCNGCHRSSGHAFIEIPTEPGQPIPRLDPLR